MPGIAYTSSRGAAEDLAAFLRAAGINAAYYHGEMKADDRARASDAFMSGQTDVLCATKAFGMRHRQTRHTIRDSLSDH